MRQIYPQIFITTEYVIAAFIFYLSISMLQHGLVVTLHTTGDIGITSWNINRHTHTHTHREGERNSRLAACTDMHTHMHTHTILTQYVLLYQSTVTSHGFSPDQMLQI